MIETTDNGTATTNTEAPGIAVVSVAPDAALLDQRGAEALHARVVAAKRDTGRAAFALGQALNDLRDRRGHEALGFPTFDAYLASDAVAIGRSTAFRFMGVAREFAKVPQAGLVDVDRLDALRRLFAPDDPPEARAALVAQVAALPRAEVREAVRAELAVREATPPAKYALPAQLPTPTPPEGQPPAPASPDAPASTPSEAEAEARAAEEDRARAERRLASYGAPTTPRVAEAGAPYVAATVAAGAAERAHRRGELSGRARDRAQRDASRAGDDLRRAWLDAQRAEAEATEAERLDREARAVGQTGAQAAEDARLADSFTDEVLPLLARIAARTREEAAVGVEPLAVAEALVRQDRLRLHHAPDELSFGAALAEGQYLDRYIFREAERRPVATVLAEVRATAERAEAILAEYARLSAGAAEQPQKGADA